MGIVSPRTIAHALTTRMSPIERVQFAKDLLVATTDPELWPALAETAQAVDAHAAGLLRAALSPEIPE